MFDYSAAAPYGGHGFVVAYLFYMTALGLLGALHSISVSVDNLECCFVVLYIIITPIGTTFVNRDICSRRIHLAMCVS